MVLSSVLDVYLDLSITKGPFAMCAFIEAKQKIVRLTSESSLQVKKFTMESVADPVAEFFSNVISAAELLSVEGDKSATTVLGTVRDDANDPCKSDARIIQWFLKMKEHFSTCVEKSNSALERISSFGYFQDTDIVQVYGTMDTDSRIRLWELLNNVNCMCILYDQREADTPFNDITQFAQRLLTMFPKEELRSGGHAEIVKHIPALINDEDMRVLIGKLCMNEDRMNRVFSLMELQFGTEIPVAQRTIIQSTLQAASQALHNDQARGVISGITDALPDILKAGQSMMAQVFGENPGLRAMADAAILATTGGLSGTDAGGESVESLEAKAASAMGSD